MYTGATDLVQRAACRVYIYNQESTFKNQIPTLWLTVHRKEVGERGKKRDTKFVTHILKWQLALVWRPMGNFWATNLCLETTLNGMLSHKCFGYT